MKVGDYVRTKDGIKKVEIYEFDNDYENCNLIYYKGNDYGIRYTNKELPKSSPNIIDLIEVGDYVNGKKVIKVWEEPFGEFAGQTFMILDGEETAPTIRTIKSIVTKEMYSSVEYRVENN